MFPKKDPRKDGRAINWDVDPVEGGSTFNAWIAGDMIGVLCHWIYRSVPCHFELTNGALSCPHCKTHPAIHWNGYLPLYKESHRPTVVVIREVSRANVEKLTVYSPVRVGRGKKKGSAITVVESTWSKRFVPPRGEKLPPDIRRWLLRLWKDDELEKWVTANPVKDPTGAEMIDKLIAADEGNERPLPASRLERQVLEKLLRTEGHAAAADKVLPTIGDCLPSVNGHHRKPR